MLSSCSIVMQLICTFVFPDARNRFSHDADHMILIKQHLEIFFVNMSVTLGPKMSGELRAVINMRPLNQYPKTQHFKMDTLKTVLNLVKKGDWVTSIDLKDAYSHVLMHRKHRKYSFLHSGQSISISSVNIWAKTSPRVFAKVVAVAAAHLRMQSIRLAVYLKSLACS